jgi:hypothetical protein
MISILQIHKKILNDFFNTVPVCWLPTSLPSFVLFGFLLGDFNFAHSSQHPQ